MPKAIVIGASSGIGYALAQALDGQGYQLGLCARRHEHLVDLSKTLKHSAVIREMDVCQAESACEILSELIHTMGSVDLIILNAGIARIDFDLSWPGDKQVIDTNVLGFSALAAGAYRYFREQQKGHLVGISSVTCHRGGPACSYNASKAYISSYLQGLRFLIAKQKLDINVTDIRPGFVDTDLIRGRIFWLSTKAKAADCIVKAIKNKKKTAYITPRWRLIGWLIELLPERLYHKL